MKRSAVSPPDDFSNSPFFAVLPVLGDTTKLPTLKTSLFARFENVTTLKKSVGPEDRATIKKLQAEESMLRSVLEWLKVRVDE